MKKSQPIRMCIACRNRYPQNSLIRLRQEGKEIIAFEGKGRSFYLCNVCSTNEKKTKGIAKRFKQNIEQFDMFLKGLTSTVNSCN